MITAVYPGVFDPVTNGHIDIIGRASKIFDKVIVAVGENPEKETLFTKEERVEMLKEATKHIKNIEVDHFSGLLLDFVKSKKSNVIVRGLRAISDFDYEFQRALLNRRVHDEIETVFIMTSEKHVFLSASIVKEMAKFGGSVNGLVPDIAEKKLKAKFSQDEQ